VECCIYLPYIHIIYHTLSNRPQLYIMTPPRPSRCPLPNAPSSRTTYTAVLSTLTLTLSLTLSLISQLSPHLPLRPTPSSPLTVSLTSPHTQTSKHAKPIPHTHPPTSPPHPAPRPPVPSPSYLSILHFFPLLSLHAAVVASPPSSANQASRASWAFGACTDYTALVEADLGLLCVGSAGRLLVVRCGRSGRRVGRGGSVVLVS